MTENRFLYAEERKNEIVKMLEKEERVQVNDLVKLFEVSGSTIRTDMRELEKEGLLTRTHGGAIRNPQRTYEDSPKVRELTEEKRSIAKEAVQLLKDGDSIAIDTGTSCFAFAETLSHSNKKNLRIVTYDLHIATLLSETTDYEIFFAGGVIRNGFQYTAGEVVIDVLNDFLVDKAIIATTSFSIAKGYSTPNVGTAELKKKLFSIAKQKIVLCDAAKIGKESFKIFAATAEADLLITDSTIDKKQRLQLEKQDIRLIVAE